MERYELLLSLAAIIFGGGMLGRLIEFFVKRRDDQNSKKMALYKRLYDKLCDYNTLLLSSVMDFITYIESTKLEIDDNSNAIKEKMSEIKTLIESHPNWEFIYIGANIDSYCEGTSIGIPRQNISNYSKSKKGTDTLFRSINYLSECMCMDKSFGNSWKEELENTK